MNSYAVFILFATRFPSYTSGQPLSNNMLTPTDEVRNLQERTKSKSRSLQSTDSNRNLNEQGFTGKWYIDSEHKSCEPAAFDSREACDAEMNDILSDGGILRDRNLNEQGGTGKWYVPYCPPWLCGYGTDSNRNLNEQTGKWFIDSVLDDGCYSCVKNVWPLHATSGTFFDSKEACDTYLDDWYLKRNNDVGGRNLQEQQTESKSRALRGGHFSG